ncbi:hypothetical protein SALB1_0409 [Salinisphaera sp. LB1]|nr:hypothetical protein SALB1_0409 [Salinisphaera sp. LB1]
MPQSAVPHGLLEGQHAVGRLGECVRIGGRCHLENRSNQIGARRVS